MFRVRSTDNCCRVTHLALVCQVLADGSTDNRCRVIQSASSYVCRCIPFTKQTYSHTHTHTPTLPFSRMALNEMGLFVKGRKKIQMLNASRKRQTTQHRHIFLFPSITKAKWRLDRNHSNYRHTFCPKLGDLVLN